ncbi:hypothetical protein [Carnobacterium maltaromaticum]|uniref:hypothetical protein n=1 Tax=Carnobacterium maltaromaticum TaxID=2751 RepID=UPI0039B10E3F
MGKLKLTRGFKGANAFRAYKVFIDDELVGKIKRKQTLEFEVPRGTHKIHCKIDWENSNELIVDIVDKPILLEVNAKSAIESAARSLIPLDGKDKYLILMQVNN